MAYKRISPQPIIEGGTNATSMATSTGIIKYDGTSLITSSTAKIDSSNRITNTSQPAFLAYLGSTVTNATGAGASFTLGSGTALTIVFDQNSNFTTAGTFTAPVTGRYSFNAAFIVTNCTVATAATITVITTNRSYVGDTGIRVAGSGDLAQTIACLADMNSGDTATFQVTAFGEAGNTDSILGSSTLFTFVSGYLVC